MHTSCNHFRRSSLRDEVIDGAFEAECFVRSLGIVEDKVVNEPFSKSGQVIDEVKVIVDELFLQSPVKSFNTAVYLWAAWVSKEVGYAFVLEIGIKLPQELGAVVSLEGLDG